jgi:hypothetical protein
MTDALASVDKKMYLSVASRELTTIPSDYATENIFYSDVPMTDDVAGFAVHNGDYEVRHHLAKSSSAFSVEISANRMALARIQICSRGRYLILLDSLSSQMAMQSRKITCKAHPLITCKAHESKQIYWNIQQPNYDVKLMWIPSLVG